MVYRVEREGWSPGFQWRSGTREARAPTRGSLHTKRYGIVAQRLEQGTHNSSVAGSTPAGPTEGDGPSPEGSPRAEGIAGSGKENL